MSMAGDGRSHWVPDPGDGPELLDLTVGGLLDRAAERWPDQDALVYSQHGDLGIDLRWSYAEYRRRALEAAAALIAAGYEPGDRVAVWATNRPEWMLLQYGAAYAGVVLVTLNPAYLPGEAAYVLERSGAAGCFAMTDLADRLERARQEAPDLGASVLIDTPEWAEFLAAGERVDPEEVDRRAAAVQPTDASQIQFTSGTTGFPKGALLHHRGFVNNAYLMMDRVRARENGGVCHAMPFFHTGGCVCSNLGAVATGSAHLPILTFDPRRMIDTIDAEGASGVLAVPTMLIALEEELDKRGGSLESLEVVISGGALVPVPVATRWRERFGLSFSIIYGQTEASPVITQSLPDDPLELQIGTCGVGLPHLEWDVADAATGETVATGAEGEVRARGWLVMKEYWANEEDTREALTDDGWLRTGDLGRMDADGYLRITGRVKDMIIRGGENIFPAEIEAALREFEEVLDAHVVGVGDERYGEVPAAYLRLRDGASLTLEAMQDRLRVTLARYKVPRHLRLVDEYPMTPSGKVQKFKLQERWAAEQGAEEVVS